MIKIHPTATVEKGAEIGENVTVGPYCYIGPNVKIGSGCNLIRHCNIEGYTEIGSNNTFYPFVSVGSAPQDNSFDPNSVSYVKIGNDNVFREHFTVNAGAKPDSVTTIGNGNLFMTGSHVGHNSTIHNNVIIANNSLLAGYTTVHDRVFISGNCCVHQFCSVGQMAMISGGVAISQDLPPFFIVASRNAIGGINLVALKRNKVARETIREIKKLYRLFVGEVINTTNAIEQARAELPTDIPEVNDFLDFVEKSPRGIITKHRVR